MFQIIICLSLDYRFSIKIIDFLAELTILHSELLFLFYRNENICNSFFVL